MRIVVIEDNKDLNRLISDNLEKAGIQTESALTGDEALNMIDAERHDLIVLDRGLPDMEGLELLKILREEGIKIPVLVLTAMDGLGDKVTGLNSGADDYLVKPFEMEELIARIHALGRRPADVINTSLKIGNFELLPAEGCAKIGDKRIGLSVKEKDALERLMRLPGRIVGKDTLQTVLYGYNEEGSKNSVEIIIHRLRKKLEKAGSTLEIHTLRGIGYLAKEKEV